MTRLEIHEARSRLIRAGYHVIRLWGSIYAYRRDQNWTAFRIVNETVSDRVVRELESA